MPKKGVTFKLRGLKEVQRGFDRKVRQITGYTTEAVTDIVLDLTGEAVEGAPVDTGALRGSGHGSVNGAAVAKGNADGSIAVTGTPPEADQPGGRVSFGEIYAATQHEMPYKHPKGGHMKYLERPFRANQSRYLQRLGEGVEKGCDT